MTTSLAPASRNADSARPAGVVIRIVTATSSPSAVVAPSLSIRPALTVHAAPGPCTRKATARARLAAFEAFGRLDNSAIDQFELFRQVRAFQPVLAL
jgi:hypothetical protein